MSQTKVAAPFVSNNANFRNLIINGDMSIAQRGTSATGLTNGSTGYQTVDRFRFEEGGSPSATFTMTQSTDVPTGQGFGYSTKFDCTTAQGSLASSDIIRFATFLEGQNLQMLKKGTSSAESTTLSFWVKSNKTGTYTMRLEDHDNSRMNCKSYTISSSDTWEKKTITFAGDTTGALDNDNALSFAVRFNLLAGTNYDTGTLQTSWGSRTDANSAVDQVNLADSTSNEWYITGIQFEIGDQATDFEHLPFDVQFQRCKRYYEKIEYQGMITTMAATATANAYARIECSVEKRADPTVTLPTAGQSSNQIAVLSGAGSYPSTIGNHAVGNPTPLGFRLEATSYDSLETGGGLMLYVNGTVHIEFSSEL